MFPEPASSFLQNVIRAMFEAQSDLSGPRSFEGIVEWSFVTGYDDGYQDTCLFLTAAPSVWSERYRAWVRPVVFVAVGSNVQARLPLERVPRFQGTVSPLREADIAGVPLDELPGTPAGIWTRALIARMDGEDPREWENGWISFTVTLPDEPPWVR